MSDDIKPDQDEKKPLDDKSVESRRSFTKTGLGGGAVLMSLLSRPASAWNNDPRCSGSILASIDAGSSLHDFNVNDCRFGCNIYFWCEEAPDIAWFEAGASKDTSFNSVFPCVTGGLTGGIRTTPPGLLDVLLQNFNESGHTFLNLAARQTVAAWLNAGILGGLFSNAMSKSDIMSKYCIAFNKWKLGGVGTDNGVALGVWGAEMKTLNEGRACPLSKFDDLDNMFYYPN